MNAQFRITRPLLDRLHADLSRPHPYAFERVAFLSCKPAALPPNGILLLASDLHTIDDTDYERDDSVGAMLGAGAFRRALQYALNHAVSMFHVHRHEHSGSPWFSKVDLAESARFVPDFWKVRPTFPHGALVLSHDCISGLVWLSRFNGAIKIAQCRAVGVSTTQVYHGAFRPL